MFSDTKNLAPLSLGTSAFEALRVRGQIYVDKTDLIYQFARKSEKFLFIRPRRFGKSYIGLSFFKGGAVFFWSCD